MSNERVDGRGSSVIGLEMILLRSGRMTGIERFAEGIWNNLGPRRVDYSRLNGFSWSFPHATVDRLLNEQLFPLLTRRTVSGMHYFSVGPPLIVPRRPFTLTVHDAVAWRFPETVSRGMKYIYRPAIESAIKSKYFRGLITVSQFSAGELQTVLGLPSKQIHVVPSGIAKELVVQSRVNRPSSREALKLPFLLTVGSIEPRKNLGELISAWKGAGEPMQLVVVGRSAWGSTPISERVRYLKYVSDAELSWLYQNAEAVVLPSIYEGFSLVPIEASVFGTRVIARSLPVYGETLENVRTVQFYQNPEQLREMLRCLGAKPRHSATPDLALADKFSFRRSAQRFHEGMCAFY